MVAVESLCFSSAYSSESFIFMAHFGSWIKCELWGELLLLTSGGKITP